MEAANYYRAKNNISSQYPTREALNKPAKTMR
jgi:hypothetical protein